MEEISVTIFFPAQPEQTLEASLRIPNVGKPSVIFDGTFTQQTPFQNIDILYASTKYGDVKYSFVNCYFLHQLNQRFEFGINELYRYTWIGKAMSDNYDSATFYITDLTSFVNKSRISVDHDIPATEAIKIIEPFVKETQIEDDLVLRLQQHTNIKYTRTTVNVSDQSCFNIKSASGTSRWKLFDLGAASIKFFSLFTVAMPEFQEAIFFIKNERKLQLTLGRKDSNRNHRFLPITLADVEHEWDTIVKCFFKHQQILIQAINLLDESVINQTAEISFLNATTCLEVIHKEFYEPADPEELQEIALELKERLNQKKEKKWIQVYRYYHLLKKAVVIRSLDTQLDNISQFSKLLTDSRNFYTHYGEKKGTVWTLNQLRGINNLLQQIIRAHLFIKLGLPLPLIDTFVSQQLFTYHHSFEKNPHSVYYVPVQDDLTGLQ